VKRVLFVLKDRLYSPSKNSYGLINSANHIANYLEGVGFECKVVTVTDGNFIDREVYHFRPDIVVIEALWVTAEKFKELFRIGRHKHIQWIVRIHSNIGYLSTESRGLKLINDYIELGDKLIISLNNKEFTEALSVAMEFPFVYLPNIITPIEPEEDYTEEKHFMKIGCFGALRLLKNQCFQAICAIQAANELGKKLYFHVTPNLELKDDPVLANLRELFKNDKHELVVHKWMPNGKFMTLIKKMDIGMQLSFTESFNIVASDFVNNNKLILVSEAIDWMPNRMQTSTIDFNEVVRKLVFLYRNRNSIFLKSIARMALFNYNEKAIHEWENFLHKHHHHREV
jgi:hypothetical protein